MSGFGTELLNVAIGMAFVYLVMSLIASAMLEVVESGLRTRAKYLWQGIGEILGDGHARGRLMKMAVPPKRARKGTVTLAEFYEHPIIGGMYYGPYDKAVGTAAMRKLPAYIPRESFSTAVIDLVSRQNTNSNVSAMQALRNGVKALPNGAPVRTALESIMRLTGDDVTLVQKRLEAWYDGAMERVTGWYKRHSQVMLLAIGLGLAWSANVDSWRLVKDLLKNEPKRQALVSAASNYVAANPKPDSKVTGQDINDLFTVLDGYPSPLIAERDTSSSRPAVNDALTMGGEVLGLLITAFAISLGAPFWFDLLNKFTVVRGGIKPKEQAQQAGDKATGTSTAGAGAPAVFVRSGPVGKIPMDRALLNH